MTRTFTENLALLAQLAVKEGLNLQTGQELIIAANIGDAPLVRLITREAYEAGAKNVFIQWNDETTQLTRYQVGSDEAIAYAPTWYYDGITQALSENAARLAITSADPSLLSTVDANRVAISSRAQGIAGKKASEYIGGFLINWSIIGAASPAWARQVFRGLPEEEAVGPEDLPKQEPTLRNLSGAVAK